MVQDLPPYRFARLFALLSASCERGAHGGRTVVGPSSRVDAPTLLHLRLEVAIRRYVLGHIEPLRTQVSTSSVG